jgi:hypothetical protein
MSGYRQNSPWNDANEIACLIIFKKLEEKGFPRGMQIKLCEGLARNTYLKLGSISAKVCNYKSLAGVNSASNNSIQSERIFKKYGHLNVIELEELYIRANSQ